MDPDAWGGTVAGSLMVLAHLLVQQVAVAAAYGMLGPNRFVGIRTEATRRTPEAWLVGHRAALRPVGIGTLVGLALAVVGAALAADGARTPGIVLPLASAGVLGVTVLLAARRASRAAERVVGHDPDIG